MRVDFFWPLVGAAMLALLHPLASQAVTVSVQYAPGTLFYSGIDGTAKATINAAAADVSAAITGSLNAIPTDMYVGTYGSTTVDFDWSYSYLEPSTGNSTTIPSATIAADTITLFAGTRSLLSDTLGVGGPSGIGLALGGFGLAVESPAAVTSAAAQSEVALLRGGGPVINSLSGAFDFNGTVTNYSVNYGISYGSLAFDNDADNNGSADSVTALNNYWHWNHATAVSAGKNDLYSVAVHEILHALGLGASDSWNAKANGTTWNGSEVQALTNSGAGLVTSNGRHIASNVMSTRISDGLPQEVVLDPTVTNGTRKELTLLDLAFLRDIGYETIMPTFSNPPDYDGDGDIDGFDLATFSNWYGVNDSGDADGDGDTDGADFLVWQQQYTGPITTLSAASVPEPGTAVLLCLGLAMIHRRHR